MSGAYLPVRPQTPIFWPALMENERFFKMSSDFLRTLDQYI
jgi:hypothetical protein